MFNQTLTTPEIIADIVIWICLTLLALILIIMQIHIVHTHDKSRLKQLNHIVYYFQT